MADVFLGRTGTGPVEEYPVSGLGVVAPAGWVADTLADAALAAAHPLFCADIDGTFYRLLPDANGLIPVGEGHADHSADDRPAIQAAINYSEAVGAAGVRFDAPAYSLWRTQRTPTAPNDIHADKTGLLLTTTRTQAFISTCPQTVLYRRDTDGSAMGIAKFTSCTGSGGYYWRGGGIFTEGATTDPGDPSAHSIHLHNIMLDGGITDSSEENSPHGANMAPNGDGWDISDKGIWQSNDRCCGHIRLTGNSGVRYFMGELIYSSGVGAGVAKRKIYLGPDVDLGHTCGSCLNGNGHTMEVERCHLHNGFIGIEGWTGELGGYIKARISHTKRDTLQGGIPNFSGTGSYNLKSRPTASIVPIGAIDLVLHKCAQFDLGSWLQGRIVAVDCCPFIGNGAAFNGGSRELDIDIQTWCDQGNVLAGVSLQGGAAGTKTTDAVTIRLDCKRTENAVANSYAFGDAVASVGSFGPSVTVAIGATEGVQHINSPGGAVPDYPVNITGRAFDATMNPRYHHDIQANNGQVCDIKAYGNVIYTSCTAAGAYSMNLPTTNIPAGYSLFVRDMTKNFVAGGATCVIPAANFRSAQDDVTIQPGYGFTELRFDGQLWGVIVPPPH